MLDGQMATSRVLCLHMPHLATDLARRARRAAPGAPPTDDLSGPGTPTRNPPPAVAGPPTAARHAWPFTQRPLVLMERPLVLTQQRGGALHVARVCPVAESLGLRPGTTLAEAQAHAPGLVALPHEPHADQACLGRMARWAERFSPTVEAVAPDTLLLEVGGCARLFRGEENLARQAVAGLRQQGFFAVGAVADTIGAAYALATMSEQEVLVAPEGQASAFLAGLPPASLRIDAATAEQLDALGVRTIGDLLMLPRSVLPARFGPHLVLRLAQALGELPERVLPDRRAGPARVGRSLDGEVSGLAELQQVAREALHELCERVFPRGEALRRVDCTLLYERAPPTSFSLRLARAGRSERHLQELLARRLETRRCAAGVNGLTLTAAETARWTGTQGDLFQPTVDRRQEALGELVDRLAARLGCAAILRPRLVDDHQPEMAFRNVCVAEAGLADCGPPPSRSVAAREAPGEAGGAIGPVGVVEWPGVAGLGRMRRPARLMSPPRLIPAIRTARRGAPAWLELEGRGRAGRRGWGPECIETGWWRGADVRRDYFRVETEDGAQAWVFHDASRRQWFLHGWFE